MIILPPLHKGHFYEMLSTKKTWYYLTLLNNLSATRLLSTIYKRAILPLVKPENTALNKIASDIMRLLSKPDIHWVQQNNSLTYIKTIQNDIK